MSDLDALRAERDRLASTLNEAIHELLGAGPISLVPEEIRKMRNHFLAEIDRLTAEVARLRAALTEHQCVEKPERGFTRDRYPTHSCWAALAGP